MKSLVSYRCLLSLGLVALLSACSSLPSGGDSSSASKDIPQLRGKTAIHQWVVKGTNIFSCARDKKGYYWRYLNTSGVATNEAGKKVADLRPNNRFVTLSGTTIELRSPQLIARPSTKDLPDVLFEAQTYSSEPAYKDTLYVLRRQAEGGVPLDTCSPGQSRHQMKVNYTAKFVLWR